MSIKTAMSMNNSAVELFLRTRHDSAVSALTRGLKLVQRIMTQRKRGVSIPQIDPKRSGLTPAAAAIAAAAAAANSDAASSSSSPMRSGSSSNLSANKHARQFFSLRLKTSSSSPKYLEGGHEVYVYKDPIMIDPNSGPMDENDLSIIIMINLALVYHDLVGLNAKVEANKSNFYTKKALQMYHVAISALRSNKTFNAATNGVYTMAVLNNLASLYGTIKDSVRRTYCLKMLLSHTVVFQVLRNCPLRGSSLKLIPGQEAMLDGFLANTQALILRDSGMAAAA